MNTMTYKGYMARVEYDDEDEIFFGRLAGINDVIGFHGETVAELRGAFHEAADGYIEACAKIGKSKSYSGQFMVRVDPKVHARAALAAQLAGKSLAKWAEERLREDSDRELGTA